VTNTRNKDASEIEITLNNKQSYKAKLIGTDSKMDIALLKLMLMKHSHTPEILILKIGEWVLAVGNPYNVNGHCWYRFGKSKRPWHKRIQSFIQTDAAVNPGNRRRR
jgi:S1-C subfamily serine protease